MKLGWTQNVVIMEADLTMELREWYIRATHQFGWSKAELMVQIAAEAHLEIVLDIEEEVCDNRHDEEGNIIIIYQEIVVHFMQKIIRHAPFRQCL